MEILGSTVKKLMWHNKLKQQQLERLGLTVLSNSALCSSSLEERNEGKEDANKGSSQDATFTPAPTLAWLILLLPLGEGVSIWILQELWNFAASEVQTFHQCVQQWMEKWVGLQHEVLLFGEFGELSPGGVIDPLAPPCLKSVVFLILLIWFGSHTRGTLYGEQTRIFCMPSMHSAWLSHVSHLKQEKSLFLVIICSFLHDDRLHKIALDWGGNCHSKLSQVRNHGFRFQKECLNRNKK